MTLRPAMTLRWLANILLLLLALGCTEDEPRRILPTGGVLDGQLVRVTDGAGYGPVELGLWDLQTLRYRALVLSDSTGRFRFEEIEPGEVLPVMFGSDQRTLHLPQARWIFTGVEHYEIKIPVAPAQRWSDSGLELRGEVVDAQSGAPIAGARIEMNAALTDLGFSEFSGRATTIEPVSDEQGRFRMAPLPEFIDPQTGRRTTPSWRLSCPGYVSQWFEGYVDGAVPSQVTVRLESGRDAFAIEGRVTRLDGRPVTGLAVFAEWRRPEGALARRPVASVVGQAFGFVTKSALEDFRRDRRTLLPFAPVVTDADGQYRIEDLPPGGYLVTAAPFADDGWVGSQLTGIQVLSSDPDSVVQAADLIAEPALEHLAPPDGGTLAQGPLTLRWEPTGGASRYGIRIQRAVDGVTALWTTTGTDLTLDEPDFFRAGGLYLWFVRAYDPAEKDLTSSERAGSFWLKS